MAFSSDLRRLAGNLFAPGRALREKYNSFKGLLEADDIALERIADVQETLYGIRPVDRVRVRRLNRELVAAVRDMAESLQAMRPLKYQVLDKRIEALGGAADRLLEIPAGETSAPWVISLSEAAESLESAGGKAANLGRAATGTDLRIPPGLVVTTRAFHLFIERNKLREPLDEVLSEALLCKHSRFARQCEEMQAMVLNARVPEEVMAAVRERLPSLIPGKGNPEGQKFAVRSSAWAEDGEFSFAGQYESVLNVEPVDLEQAWLQVAASKYAARSVTYRILRGLSDTETPMGVLILPMIDARAAGVAYSRDPEAGGGRRAVSVHAVSGLGVSLVDGSDQGDVYLLSSDERPAVLSQPEGSGVLSEAEAERVAAAALELEQFFGEPQDVEWCLDGAGQVHIVQCRPFRAGSAEESGETGKSDYVPDVEPLLTGLVPVSMGAGSGRILYLHDAQDPAEAPRGSVVVFETLAPNLTRCLDRVEAVIGGSGGRAGHFATVAREFGIPVVVGPLPKLASLEENALVTVDGTAGCVYPGRLEDLVESAEAARKRARALFHETWEPLIPVLTRLNLTDAEDENFTAEGCGSMHDLIRYIHEKGVREMFDLVGKSGRGMSRSRKIITELPLTLYVLPLDSDFPGRKKDGVLPEDIGSRPMRTFWSGLSSHESRWDDRLHHMDWEEMDRVSAGIFSKESRFLSSYALVAEDYMHMMIRFGYHFSVLDSVCGAEDKNNYARFRFKGGGADFDGRLLRLGFIERVLRACGFGVEVRSDMLDASLSRKAEEATRRGLDVLGRLLAETRLMDMRLTDTAEVEELAEQFIVKLDALAPEAVA